MPEENYVETIRRIFALRLQSWERLFAGDEAVDCLSISDVRNNREYNYDEFGTPAWHILHRLGHIPANPYRDDNSKFISESYAFAPASIVADQSKRKIIDYDIVNASLQSVKLFIERITESARRELLLVQEYMQSAAAIGPFVTDRVFFLTGGKGVGKTYFQNYLLSKFSNYFDEKKTVVVRVNLVADRGFGADLESRIAAQTSKIILKYYDKKSPFFRKSLTLIDFSFRDHIKNWVRENYRDDAARLRYLLEAAEYMCESFQNKYKEKPISPELCPKILCDEIFAKAKSLDFAFIVIIDGYDRLEADEAHSSYFSQNKSGLIKLLSNYELIGYLCIVSMRTVTYEFERSSLSQYKVASQYRYHVASAGFEAVISRRFETILDEIGRLPLFRSTGSILEWRGFVKEFQRQLALSSGDTGPYIATVNDMFVENNRVKMNAIKIEFQRYIANNNRYGYRIFEMLMKSGNIYPPIFFRFVPAEAGISYDVINEGGYDNRILPVIFRPPLALDANNIPDPRTPLSPFTILIQLRCLQFANCCDDMKARGLIGDPLLLHECEHVFEACFGYRKEQTRLALIVLESFECLNISESSLGVKIGPDSTVTTTAKGIMLLEQCIYDVAVLNLNAMRLPLKPASDRGKKVLNCAALDQYSSRSVRKWITTKILNSVALASLVLSVNSEQEKTYDVNKVDGRAHSIAVHFRRVYGAFRRIKRLEQSVISEAINIVGFGLGEMVATRVDSDDIDLHLCLLEEHLNEA